MRLKGIIQNIIHPIINLFREIYIINSPHYRIEEIDLDKQTVTLYCRGGVTIFSLHFSDIISDQAIISKLRSRQACFLGYYYGKMVREFTETSKSTVARNINNGFMLKHKTGRFRIFSQDRKGLITYIDTKTQKSINDMPANIASNQKLISNFDPCQAYYIGILAGMHFKIIDETPHALKRRPILRLVQ